MSHMDQFRTPMGESDFQSILQGNSINPVTFEEDLYAVIVDRTKGEAAVKVRNESNKNGEGKGVRSFQTLYLWYSTASGLAVQDRLRKVMTPSSPKKVEEISPVLESWLKEVEDLESHGTLTPRAYHWSNLHR